MASRYTAGLLLAAICLFLAIASHGQSRRSRIFTFKVRKTTVDSVLLERLVGVWLKPSEPGMKGYGGTVIERLRFRRDGRYELEAYYPKAGRPEGSVESGNWAFAERNSDIYLFNRKSNSDPSIQSDRAYLLTINELTGETVGFLTPDWSRQVFTGRYFKSGP
ncbi:MAG: hypothetical protein AAGB22_03945 [Bacteroidota bacterium]